MKHVLTLLILVALLPLLSVEATVRPAPSAWEEFYYPSKSLKVVSGELILYRLGGMQAGIGGEDDSKVPLFVPLSLPITIDNGQLVVNHQPVAQGTLEELYRQLGALVPAIGLQQCSSSSNETSSLPDRIEVVLRLQEGKVLKFRSDSSCSYRLPWNVTNGNTFWVSRIPEFANALAPLIEPACPDCIKPQNSSDLSQDILPPLLVKGPFDEKITFANLFMDLQSEWIRLGYEKHGALWNGVHTQSLISALQWMDSERFHKKLVTILNDPKSYNEEIWKMAKNLLMELEDKKPSQ